MIIVVGLVVSQAILLAMLYHKVVRMETLMTDVLMDVSLYEIMKKAAKQAKPVSRTINTVGRWKK